MEKTHFRVPISSIFLSGYQACPKHLLGDVYPSPWSMSDDKMQGSSYLAAHARVPVHPYLHGLDNPPQCPVQYQAVLLIDRV